MRVKEIWKRLPVWLLVAISLTVTLYPLFWILLSSIKPAEEQYMLPAYGFPNSPTFKNYKALAGSMIPVYFKNSVIVTAVSLLGIVVLGALAGYPLSKMRFKGREFIRNFIMLGLMVPVFVSLIPLFSIYNKMGIINTHWALIIPKFGFALPISMYLYMAFFDQIPDSLLESARIDGAGSLRIFCSIILPLSRNTIVTVAIYQFVNVWNEFTFANTFISTRDMKTVPVGLNDFINSYGLRDWGLTFSAVAVTVLPTLILFFILNKQVMSGMTAGAVKG
ncbi:MAG: carbohydrate ABC transporter permease [Hungatella sp.]|jgi:raffinose/stachyose/melibiose transport system permease protein|nr:carbohydrate ABC transporter permease [Hungatella sp.]